MGNVGTSTVSFNEAASYVVSGGAYVAYAYGKGGEFVKNTAIAAAPWMFKNLYTRVKGWMGIAGRPVSTVSAVRRVAAPMSAPISRFPAPAYAGEFNGVRLD
jgi:hypothetical protein